MKRRYAFISKGVIACRRLLAEKYGIENDKLAELNRLLKIQIKNVEGKALNFSSKLILAQVQLGLEKEKNQKLSKQENPSLLENQTQSAADLSDTKSDGARVDKIDLVEKLQEIKDKEKDLIKAKKELFNVEDKEKNESDSEEKNEINQNPNNIEIKVKIEKPDETKDITEDKTTDLDNTENQTSTLSTENKNDLEISTTPEANITTDQNSTNNASDTGLVDKINEIKQKQQEIEVAKESIINKLQEPKSTEEEEDVKAVKPAKDDITKEAVLKNDDAEDLANKIKEIKSKELELNEAKENLFNDDTSSTTITETTTTTTATTTMKINPETSATLNVL